MSYAKLRGKIREVFGAQKAFGEAIGMSEGTTSLKLNGKVDWTRQEMEDSCKALGIPIEHLPAFFYPE